MTTKTSWQSKSFSELSLNQLYDVIKLRIDIFVVEQTCYYPDLDGEDGHLDRHPNTVHLLGFQNEEIVAYLRILPKGESYPNYISIGRVVIATSARGGGLGHELIEEALLCCAKNFPNEDIKISAQEHLKLYYQKHGFIQASSMYLEDGIPHIAMIRAFEK